MQTAWKPMVADVSRRLYDANNAGQNLLFEGAQGTLLDIDHGTHPFVTSSNRVAGAASAGAGVGPQKLNYILGITKAYCTRVGSYRSRAESYDADNPQRQDQAGVTLANVGRIRFGHRPSAPHRLARRSAAPLDPDQRRVGPSMTKLDVLDGLDEVKQRRLQDRRQGCGHPAARR